MKPIYFGPPTSAPSWSWIGQDIAEHLRNKVAVHYISDFANIPAESIVFWIKRRLDDTEIDIVQKKRLKLIFMPVDTYKFETEIQRDFKIIEQCTFIVLHSPTLAEYFPRNKVRFIEHYNKFGIPILNRRPKDFYLWIGGFQYFPFAYQFYLSNRDLHNIQIVFLSDFNNPRAVDVAAHNAHRIGLDIDISKVDNLRGIKNVEWSVETQRKLLTECVGAFDYKYLSDFNQYHKPATKIQKYLCSGIPCAINQERKHCISSHLELCDPLNIERWSSVAYRKLVENAGKELARTLTKEKIAEKYSALIRECVTGIGNNKTVDRDAV